MDTVDTWFDDTVAGFYRAANGLVSWGQALEAIRNGVRSMFVQLMGVDLQSGRLAFTFEAGEHRQEAVIDFVRTWHAVDPRSAWVFGSPLGTWVSCHERFDDAFVATDPFYQQFLIPYGIRYASGIKLIEDEGTAIVFAVLQPCGSSPLSSDELAVCNRLASHLREAMLIYRRRSMTANHGSVGSALLERLRHPVLLMDAQRRLLFANVSARELIDKQDGLIERKPLLGCHSRSDEANLVAALRQMHLVGEVSINDKPISEKIFMRVDRVRAAASLLLYIFAIRPQSTLHAFGDTPLAMVLIHDPLQGSSLDRFIVAATYDFTPAEADVAVELAQGLTPAQIAKARAVSLATVRSQMKAAFLKAGVTRQADLVSKLLSMPLHMLRND